MMNWRRNACTHFIVCEHRVDDDNVDEAAEYGNYSQVISARGVYWWWYLVHGSIWLPQVFCKKERTNEFEFNVSSKWKIHYDKAHYLENFVGAYERIEVPICELKRSHFEIVVRIKAYTHCRPYNCVLWRWKKLKMRALELIPLSSYTVYRMQRKSITVFSFWRDFRASIIRVWILCENYLPALVWRGNAVPSFSLIILSFPTSLSRNSAEEGNAADLWHIRNENLFSLMNPIDRDRRFLPTFIKKGITYTYTELASDGGTAVSKGCNFASTYTRICTYYWCTSVPSFPS